jgi:hypothetical protein
MVAVSVQDCGARAGVLSSHGAVLEPEAGHAASAMQNAA